MEITERITQDVLSTLALLEMVRDQLADTGGGPDECHENRSALADIMSAISWLEYRDDRRIGDDLADKMNAMTRNAVMDHVYAEDVLNALRRVTAGTRNPIMHNNEDESQ